MIPDNFTDAFAQVKNLVRRFNANEKDYLSAEYQEANVRQEFLDKFFVALGWDVYHERQTNPYQREVRIEKSIQVEGRGKRADYAFFVAPNFQQTRFIAEAKKPIHNLENADFCFQALRYGWNSNTPLAILTDFDRLFILDSRYKPSIETAISRIHKRFRYTDFADEEKFREIYYLFSREAVFGDSIEKYVADFLKGAKKKGKQIVSTQVQPVDEVFLKELDEQREKLAKSFKNRNANLDGEELTEITQRTLDRLVFIRFLEDKLVEANELINNFGAGKNSAWQDFTNESVRLNKIYNGIIFKPHSILDNPNFAPDERAFEETRDWISARNSAYDFNTIPIHILGSIYERFLGKTIVATDKRARIEEKPEVRKAGGVYYTPEYIVRYIVEKTIGKLIENKKPEEIAEMRFADIACGSGSFLLGVFDFLITYHVKYFSENKTRRDKALKEGIARENADGVLQLTIPFKKEILLNNIYGVDLDAQAVEVAQLSLYLKLLEEETTSTAQLLTGLREQLLPSLDKNIVFGNSLIDDKRMLFDFEQLKSIKPLNFEMTFPEVFRKGGFDAIVGNPPYVRQELFSEKKWYFQKEYKTYHGVADLYVYFFERYINLLKTGGEFGIIVANKWLRANYGEPLRKWLKKFEILEITDFGDLPVFQGATTYPCIVVVRKNESDENFSAAEIESLEFAQKSLSDVVDETKFEVNKNFLADNGWSLTDETVQNLLNKLREKGVPLGEYVDGKIYRGVLTGLNEAFVIDAETKDKLIAEDAKSAELIKPFLAGRDIKRYEKPNAEKFLILMPKGWTNKQMKSSNVKNAFDFLSKEFPAIAKHLLPFKKQAEKRYDKGEFWWELRACDYYDEFEKPKIIVPAIVKNASYAFDTNQNYSNDKTTIIQTSDLYFLGLISSKVVDFFMHSIASTKQGGYYEYKPMYLVQLPIRTIDFDNPKEKEAHDRVVKLAANMLEAKRKLAAEKTDTNKRIYQRLCDSLDAQIDETVYNLYDLNAAEIEIVEGKA